MLTPQKFFLKASGHVTSGKHNEFEQTVQFIFNMMPPSCVSRNLALDVHHTNLYHFYSVWTSREALMDFKASHAFELLHGAYQTLGSTGDTAYGPQLTFELFYEVDLGESES